MKPDLLTGIVDDSRGNGTCAGDTGGYYTSRNGHGIHLLSAMAGASLLRVDSSNSNGSDSADNGGNNSNRHQITSLHYIYPNNTGFLRFIVKC